MATGRTIRKYTAEERAEALRLSDEVGSTKAAAQLGMPVSTIWNWRSDERKKQKASKCQEVEVPATPKQVEPPAAEQVAQEQSQQSQVEQPKRKHVAKVYTPSQRAEALEMLAAEGAAKTSDKLGISRFSLYEWARKQRAFEQGQATDSPLVGLDEDPANARDARIVKEWKQHPGLGPSQIRNLIAKIPQHNGKVEVLNANAQKELFNQERFFDLGEAAARLRAWVAFYNMRRTHHALGGLLVPADRYFGRSDEVVAQIEAGGVPDGIGEPISLAERNLDVMRVSSRAGKLELWMMGQRVWPQVSAS